MRATILLSTLLISFGSSSLFAQASYPPPSAKDVPNPYKTITGWAQLPDGRKWGSTAGIDVGPDGNIWAYDRCAANNCSASDLDPVIEFDQKTGAALKHFGKGLFVQPHGFYVDKGGNVWVADAQGTKDGSKGFQVVKFSPDGQVLLTLGKKGQQGTGPDAFGAPTDVIVAPNGDIFVTDGHSGCNCPNNRVVKFDKNGKFLMEFGKTGTGPGEFNGPHALAFDSRGRLFVGDRTNNRVQIFDQKGKFIAEWKQFGRPSGIFISGDTFYVTDSESQVDKPEAYGYNPGGSRGIRVGSIKTGKVSAMIPDPEPKGGTSISEGVAADHDGNIYGAEVGPRDLKKYVKQ
jgi:sugar lactone lactonase YvrE